MTATIEPAATTYQMEDGSPRYGVRTEDGSTPAISSPFPAPVQVAGNPEDVAREASELTLQHLVAAIDFRLTRRWADVDHPRLVQLRANYPEQLKEARRLVNTVLGGHTSWLLKAQKASDLTLAPVVARRRLAGHTTSALWQRLPLPTVLIMFPLAALVLNGTLAVLLLAGIGSFVAATIGGHIITTRTRLPVQPRIRSRWLKDIRQDIVDATLASVLYHQGVELERRTAEVAVRGWEHVRFIAAKINEMGTGFTE